MSIRRITINICLCLLSLLQFSNINADVCNNETSTQGKEFWIAFLQNHDEELIIPHGLDLIISSEKATDIRIENNVLYDSRSEDGLYHWNITMEPNSTTVITVPCQLFNPLEYGTVIDRTLHIISTEPISVYLDSGVVLGSNNREYRRHKSVEVRINGSFSCLNYIIRSTC